MLCGGRAATQAVPTSHDISLNITHRLEKLAQQQITDIISLCAEVACLLVCCSEAMAERRLARLPGVPRP